VLMISWTCRFPQSMPSSTTATCAFSRAFTSHRHRLAPGLRHRAASGPRSRCPSSALRQRERSGHSEAGGSGPGHHRRLASSAVGCGRF
jgi:hypothetical protein